jgi:site-specific DNA-methyltransferase (adenine-specific)
MVILFNEDCLTGLDRLPVGSVDVIVTSPPYNLGKDYGAYGDALPEGAYLAWLGKVAVGLESVLSREGSFFLNLGGPPSDPLFPWRALSPVLEAGFVCQNVIHWVKSITVGEGTFGHFKPINSARFVNGCHEYVFHLTKTGVVPLDRYAEGLAVPYADKTNLTRGTRGKNGDRRCRGDCWHLPYETKRLSGPHPATFPVELPRRCIQLHGVDWARSVLDPFMGTGTTALAAVSLGVPEVIGFELNPLYVTLAKERLCAAS